MKKYLLIFIISISYKYSFSQVVPPQGITYQAVIIDRSIKELPGKDITERYYSNVDMVVKFSILSSQTGATEYEETQITKTDVYGLLNLIIGQGTPIGKNFNTIDWSKNEKWLKVEIDFNKKGSFELFSLEKMWSVPYALYSQRAAIADSIKGGIGSFKEKDGDTLNEIQTLNVKGDSIFISRGNSIKINHPANWDNDSTNEIQLLSRVKDSVFISKGNGINLADLRDKDIDSTNEIQDLILSNDSIGLSRSTKKIALSSLLTDSNNYIGKLYQGGIIVSLWKVNGVEHGLIASLTDISSFIQWTTTSFHTTTVPGGSKSFIDGRSNSNAIMTQAGAGTNYAAGICRAYNAGGYNDWYLPSIWELYECYKATFIVNTVIGETNGLKLDTYFSSTEDNNMMIWSFNFYSSSRGTASKGSGARVRAVRRF